MLTILDGPLGTQLARRGVPLSSPSWSALALEIAPEKVAEIHSEYARAGATVHTANTFRTRRRALGARWERVARDAVRLARAAVPSGHRVAGSLAPAEDCYRPDLSPGAGSRREHRELAMALVDEGVDLLLCETFPAKDEACVAVEEAVRTGVEVWVALTAGPDGALMTPAAMREAGASCVAVGAAAVLVNCTAATRTLPFVLALSGLGVPVGAYANAGGLGDGIGWDADARRGSLAYAALARAWIKRGPPSSGDAAEPDPITSSSWLV